MHFSSAPRGLALLFKFPPRWLILDRRSNFSPFIIREQKSRLWLVGITTSAENRGRGRGRIHANFVLRPLNLPPFHRAVLCIISRKLDPLQWFTLGKAIKLTLAIIFPRLKFLIFYFHRIYIYMLKYFRLGSTLFNGDRI